MVGHLVGGRRNSAALAVGAVGKVIERAEREREGRGGGGWGEKLGDESAMVRRPRERGTLCVFASGTGEGRHDRDGVVGGFTHETHQELVRQYTCA